MAGGNLAIGDELARRSRELQQTQSVGDMRAALADDLGEIALGVAELLDEPLIAARFLDRVEIGALHILDDGELQGLAVVELMDDDGNFGEMRELRRPPAPLAGHDLIGVGEAGDRAHDDGLNDALLADGGGEIGQVRLAEIYARVSRIGPQELDRHAPLPMPPVGRGSDLRIADQGREASPQTARTQQLLSHDAFPL